jgi:hypothetical protein
MASILPADPTLDEIRAALAPLIAASAAFDGFGPAALDDAARSLCWHSRQTSRSLPSLAGGAQISCGGSRVTLRPIITITASA